MPRFQPFAAILLALMTLTGACTTLRAQSSAQTSGGRGSSSSGQGSPQQTLSSPSASVDVSGLVLNGRTHQPIARALVQFGTRRVLTDHDGIFHLPEVTVSSGYFRAQKPGFFPESDNSPHLYNFPSDKPIELTLYPEAILSGSVIDTNGEAVPRLSVIVRSSTYNESGHHWFPAGRAQTLSDGSFRLSLPSGLYALQLLPTGRAVAGTDVLQSLSVPANFASLNDAIHLSPGDQVHLDLRPRLRRAYDVGLHIERTSERGFPMITARAANGPPINLSAIPNRDDPGSVHVALPNGTYELIAEQANQDGRQQGRTSVTVAGHDVSGVQLALSPVPVFPVAVEVDTSATSDNTTPIPTATQLGIVLYSLSTTADFAEQVFTISSRNNATPTIALPEGAYRLRSRSGGAWYITAATCGGTDLLQQSLTVDPGAGGAEIRVRVSNRTADLSGSVSLRGEPAAAWVYLIETTPSASPIVFFRSGTAGTFSHPYLPPGTYRAVALEHQVAVDLQSPEALNRFLTRVQTLTLNPGDHATLNLNLVPAAELTP